MNLDSPSGDFSWLLRRGDPSHVIKSRWPTNDAEDRVSYPYKVIIFASDLFDTSKPP